MKKTVLICCTFIIFNCNAQIDTLAVDIQLDTSKFNSSKVQEFNSPKIQNSKLKTQKGTVQLKKHDPKTASCLAIIPGAGQIYNKKYWKLPIVYAGLGTTAFLIYYYEDLTSMYRKEYVARVNGDVEKLNPKLAKYTDVSNILELRNFYRRNMEICIGVCAVVYVLSILDACVDAHLFYYDVSDNLSLGVKPKINYNPINGAVAPGMGLIVKF
jgi:hypothetical protein